MMSSRSVYLVDGDGIATVLSGAQAASDGGGRISIERAIGLEDPELARRLREAVSRAIGEAQRAVLMSRMRCAPQGRLVMVRPARERGLAIVRLDDLEAPAPRLSSKTLIDLFKLSPSEAEIAVALVDDHSVAEIARDRGVQIETVRGQIKNLLRKMELGSQKQLVRVLTRVADALE